MGCSSENSDALSNSYSYMVEEEIQTIDVKVKWVNGSHEDDEDEEEKTTKKIVEEVNFKIQNDVELRWLMIKYCDRIGAGFQATRFEFKGARLRESDTPLQLSMLSSDVIYAYHFTYGYGRSAVHHVTVCIRMHKDRDIFVRVRRAAPLLPQLMRSLSDASGPKEAGSISFVHDRWKLNERHTADDLEVEDGDIIDAFDFQENNKFEFGSSLRIIEQTLVLVVFSQHHKSRQFRLKRSCRLSTLMKKYCELESLEPNEIVFRHVGRILAGSKTADEAQLKDGDEIEAFLRQ